MKWNLFWFFLPLATVDGHTIEYIISSRGKIQLLVDGYTYYLNKAEKDKRSFYCIQYKVLRFVVFSSIKYPEKIDWIFDGIYWCVYYCIWFNRCPAKVRVYKNNRFVIVCVEHNHPLHVPRRKWGQLKST